MKKPPDLIGQPLSRTMRQELKRLSEDEQSVHYVSQVEPLRRRGLVEYEMKEVLIRVRKPVARLTPAGVREKFRNDPE